MIKLQIVNRNGEVKEVEAQVWPAHKDSPTWNAVHLRDGRSFQLSKPATTLLVRQGCTLNVMIGDQDYTIKRLV